MCQKINKHIHKILETDKEYKDYQWWVAFDKDDMSIISQGYE